MPSKSPAQKRFMNIAAHSPEFAKKAGIPQSVAKEFHEADKEKDKKDKKKKRKKPAHQEWAEGENAKTKKKEVATEDSKESPIEVGWKEKGVMLGFPPDSIAAFLTRNEKFIARKSPRFVDSTFDGTGFIPSFADLNNLGTKGILRYIKSNRFHSSPFPNSDYDLLDEEIKVAMNDPKFKEKVKEVEEKYSLYKEKM